MSLRFLRVVRVLARIMIGAVNHFRDLRDLRQQRLLDAVLERRFGGAATLAAAAHLEDGA